MNRMNGMKRMTINLLGAGLLLGVTAARAEEQAPAAFDEKAAATAAYFERQSALPWTELRDRFDRYSRTPIPPWPKGDKELEERFKPPHGEIGASGNRIFPVRRELQERKDRAYEEITKRQGEVYKQIDEGKVDEAFPTVFDLFVLCDWLTEYARGGRAGGYFGKRAEVLLDQAGQERAAAQRLKVEEAVKKYREEARQEYEAAVKAGIEANPELAAAERRLKDAKAKLEALGLNEKGEPKGGPPKSPGETPDAVSMLDKAAAEAAAKEYREAEGAVRRFKEAFDRNPENWRLKQASDSPAYDWMTGVMQPGPNWSGGVERGDIKYRLGWHGPEYLMTGPDPAPDPALPRIDESGGKPGTAKTLNLGNPSTSSGQGNVKLELVWIPAGEFMMGSPTNEPGRYGVERLHRVKLTKGLWMGKYEVTQEQWQRVMGNNPSWFTNAGPKAPVETVRLDQAQKFMRKLGELIAGKDGGGKFRLPTEAEWEWACRADTTTALYNGKMTIKGGNNSPELGAIAWYAGNSGVDYEGGVLSTLWEDKEQNHHSAGTHPVGQKKPNAWGLYDMLGNVGEWCADYGYAYPSQAVTDPTGPKESMGDNGMGWIVRGGGYNSPARLGRSATRSNYATHEYCWRNATIGFRVAMDEPAAAGQAAEKAK